MQIRIVRTSLGSETNSMHTIVRLLKLNNVQYNANRDPQAYRRCVGELFRIEALLPGSGDAVCRIESADGATLAEETLRRPASFSHELSFDTPGTRIVHLRVEAEEGRYEQDLRLDVLERAWVG
jgi:hypothetical protein